VAGTEDAQQLENVILHRAHEMISAPLDDAVIDYRVVGAGTDAEGKAIERILLVVAYRDSIEKYLAATDAAGLGVVGIDLEAFALLRATTSPRDKRDPGAAALAAICVDRERTTLAISDGEVCHFTRVLEWGEANIDAAVARGLALAPAEAAEAWRTMSGTESTGTEVGYSQAALHEIVGRELQTLVRELQSTLRFYRSQPNSLLVDMVLLSGALADVPGVTEELHGQLDVHLAVIDPFTRVSIGEGVLRPDRASDLSVAIGLGIED
jgi:type IV pilus assembly protein PilM